MVLQHRLGGYREYSAPPGLAPFCEAVWTYKTPTGHEGATHRVLPDPAVNIQLTYLRDAAGQVREPQVAVGGPIVTPLVAGFESGREIVALKVKLEWGNLLLDGLPRLARRVLDRLHYTSSIQETTDLLIAHMVPPPRTGGVATRALDVVRRARGRCDVEWVASQVDVSPRHLRRQVEREAGVTIKTYARTLRLLRAVTIADACPATGPIQWASVAADTGFYDQSHLIRECHALCGLTPGEILTERRTEMVGQNEP
jgi:AraC-like DNA-binding protein